MQKGRKPRRSPPDPSGLVRALRDRLGLTQEKFAAKVGVAFPTVNRWENRRAIPSPLAIARLRDLAGQLGEEGAALLRYYLAHDL